MNLLYVDLLAFIFILTPIVEDNNDSNYENYIHYSQEHKELTIQYRLSYEEIVNAHDVDEVFQIMIYSFLQALDIYSHLDEEAMDENSDLIEDFDFTAWKGTIEQLFEAEGWLINEDVV